MAFGNKASLQGLPRIDCSISRRQSVVGFHACRGLHTLLICPASNPKAVDGNDHSPETKEGVGRAIADPRKIVQFSKKFFTSHAALVYYTEWGTFLEAVRG